MNLLCDLVIGFAVWKLFSAIHARNVQKRNQRELERIRAEQAKARAEAAQMREAIRIQEQREKARQREQDALRREQERQAKEQQRQAAQLAKHETMLAKQQLIITQATEDIEQIKIKIDSKRRYADFLEEQRDKCSYNSAEFWKWQNKLDAEEEKLYKLDKRRNKAVFDLTQAQKKLA